MALANVSLTDTFDTWRIRTNQLVVIDNNLTEGEHITSGTIVSTNTGTAINVTAGSIKVKNNVFSSNAISLKSNSISLTVSGDGRLGTTVYFDIAALSTSTGDQSAANIAAASTVNLVNEYAVGIYRLSNTGYTQANLAFSQANTGYTQANLAYLKANAAAILVSNTTPSAQSAGTLWWNNDYGRLFIYYNDGDTTQWVDTSPYNDVGASAFNQANAAYTVANTRTNLAVNDKTTSMPYALVVSDSGKTVIGANVSATQNTIFIPTSVFSSGNTVTIYNNSAAVLTLTQNSGVTMYLAGTSTTGNRSIAQRGFAQLYCVFANNFVVSGTGVS